MNFNVGLTALRTSQFAIQNVSHNLANVETEGYHRQRVDLHTVRDLVNSSDPGRGVAISGISRYRSFLTEAALTGSIADSERIGQSLQIETRIERLLAPGEGSAQDALAQMFDEFTRLSANPEESSLRESILTQGTLLSNELRDIANEFIGLQAEIQQQLDLEIDGLNEDLASLNEIQARIRINRNTLSRNNDLDERDRIINRIAERIDIERFEYVQDQLGASIAGSSIAIDDGGVELESIFEEDGQLALQIKGSEGRGIVPNGGRIAALLDAHNTLVTNYESEINNFATELIQAFDQAHAVGVGPSGGFGRIQSTRIGTSVTDPLNTAFELPMQNGDLSIGVIDSNGNRTTTRIAIDPELDSLSDVANRITAIDNLNATVDPESGVLTISANNGYQFDFTGQVDTVPDLTSWNSTAIPSVQGIFTGNVNEEYTLTMLDSGTVGKTVPLEMELRNASGQLIKQFDIGEGYVAGDEIELTEGLTIAIPVGDVVLGESVEIKATANADTANLLSAVGLNSFFSGTSALDIGISDQLLEDPGRLATAKSAQAGDTGNLQQLISLRTERTFGDGDKTFEGYFEELNTNIGFQIQTSSNIQVGIQTLRTQYEQELASISGVDVNEELVRLTQHQKTYEAAVQVVRTMESMLDELFQLVR